MTALDTRLRPRVLALIAKYGKDMTFDVRSKAPSAADGEPTYGAETDVTVKAVPPYPYEARLIDGDVIRAGDLRTILAAQDLAFRPAIGMRAKFETAGPAGASGSGPVEALVVAANPIYSGELVCAWDLQLRT